MSQSASLTRGRVKKLIALSLPALFSGNCIGKWRWIYVVWVWWAAVYLTHHFVVDVLGALFLVHLTIFLVRLNPYVVKYEEDIEIKPE